MPAAARPRHRFARPLMLFVAACAALTLAGCGGGGPRVTSADLAALPQPTPDPTLDAVVRGLARPAPAQPTPTPTPPPPAPKPAATAAKPPAKPAATPARAAASPTPRAR
jgi:hypothetical protein